MIEELNKNFENFRSQYIPKLDDEAKRIEAFKDFKKLGFPNKKLEDWKFSDFNSIISNKIQTIKVSLERNEKFKFENFIKDFDHLKIFFFNGFFVEEGEEFDEKKGFNYVRSYNGLKGNFSKEAGFLILKNSNNALESLNDAFFTDGLSVATEKDFEFKKPIVIYNIFEGSKKNNFFNNKIRFVISENSKIDVMIYNINIGKEPIFFNLKSTFHLEKNSIFKLYNLSDFKENDVHYNFGNIFLEENSVYENFENFYSGGFSKSDLVCNLNKSYCSCFINGCMLSKNKQHHELKTLVRHNDEKTKSHQKIKTVLDANSKGVFQGKIKVNSKAQKTDGYQLSKALLLDKDSEFDSKPELEIYADDVKCSHGSTSGNLDEEAIFYLMSRGINRDDAKKLLIKGFLTDSVESITNKEIKKYFLKRIESKINEYR